LDFDQVYRVQQLTNFLSCEGLPFELDYHLPEKCSILLTTQLNRTVENIIK